MFFKKIKIHNIRSYEDAEIEFPEGSVLLSGDIGSGKTSILVSIEFALFGLQPGQKGASILKAGTDEGSVELTFEVDGEEITVKRTLKRKKTVSQDVASVTINGKTEEKATTELKSFVLNILNYPLEFAKKTNLLYRFTVYTPQEQMKQIILEDPESRLNTLRHVFGIDKYKRIKENTNLLTSKLRESTRLKQGQIADFEPLKLSLEKRKKDLTEIKMFIPKLELDLVEVIDLKVTKEKDMKDIREKLDEKNRLGNEVEKTNILLITKNEQIRKFTSEMDEMQQRLEEATKSFDPLEFNSVIDNITTKKSTKEDFDKKIANLSTQILTLMNRRTELEKLKEKISSLQTCPTCLQLVSDTHKHAILDKTNSEMEIIDKEKYSFNIEKQNKQASLDEITKELENLDKKKNLLQELKIRLQSIEENRSRFNAMEKQKNIVEKDIILLNEQLITLRNIISEMKKFDAVIESKENEFSEILLKEKNIEIKKAEVIKEVELSEKEILNIEVEITTKEKIKKELAHILELENWMANDFLELIGYIEKNVMMRLREEFSRLFNDWFSILVPDEFVVRLDENFTPIIEQQDYELDYNFLSGGERTAIALAYRLALNQTINSLLSEIKTKGLVILDEPTEGFSQQQLDKMRDVLKQLNVNQLIMVSHDQKIESFVDNIIRLDKSTGSSKVLD